MFFGVNVRMCVCAFVVVVLRVRACVCMSVYIRERVCVCVYVCLYVCVSTGHSFLFFSQSEYSLR